MSSGLRTDGSPAVIHLADGWILREHSADMGVQPDTWIRRMAVEHGMIEPFAEAQVRQSDDGEAVISYGISQRTQEFGIRLALGAQSSDVTRMVLRSGITLVIVGLLSGTLIFLVVSRVLESLLYGVGGHDPFTFVAALGVLAVVAVLASYIPARRAARLDPVVALRAE